MEDKFIIFMTPTDHIKHTKPVLGLLKDTGVTFKLKKYAFFNNRIEYLSLVIRLGKLEVANYSVEVICGLQVSITMTEFG